MARNPARSRKLPYRIGAAVSLVLATLAGLVMVAPNAFAHHPIVSGVSSCLDDGSYQVTWTVTDSESSPERYMLLRSFSVTSNPGGQTGTTTGLVANSSYTGLVTASTPTTGMIVAPSGNVGAITTTIPAGTTSVTLNITGYWHYQYPQGGTNEVTQAATPATVDLSKVCQGELDISKTVTGGTAPSGTTFHVTYDNGKGTSGTVDIKNGETKKVTGLPFGSYTLAETGNPPNDTVTITPNPAIVNADHIKVSANVTNAFPDPGGFTVTKHVTGETAGYVSGSSFTVHYVCTDANSTTGNLTLTDGQTGTVTGLPVGTTCTLTETAKPATTDSSYVYGTEAFVPGSTVTIVQNQQNNMLAVTLNNPIVRERGGFTVTKHVTGETAGYVANSTFTVTYTCSDGSNGTLTLKDGETKGVGDLPLLTTCSLSETVKPATTDASYAYGAESFSPSNTLTVNSTSIPVSVTLTNPINRVLGGFTVTKHVTGETAGYSGGTFTVHYVCNDQLATSGDLTLTNGTTDGKGGLPLGFACALSETAKAPVKDASYAWGAESFSVNPVTVNSTTTPVAVTLTNPITRVLGRFSVTKHVTGETAGYVADSLFTVGYTCSDGTTGTLTVKDGGTASVGNLPLLTTCTLSETAKPATADGSYAYGTETWTPSNTVTIASSDSVAAVTLTNPITRVLGGFSVTKHVTGETAGYVADSLFTVGYTCSDGTTGTLTVKDGGTASVGNLPLLTTCTLSETAKPATTDGSYAYGTETWTPSNTVTIASSDPVAAVTLTNPITRVLGGFQVTKQVTGAVAGYVTGSLFTVSYTCSNGTTGTLTLSNGSTTGAAGLPVGTTCTLTESAKPATNGSTYAYQAESWSPSNVVTITANGTANTVALTLTNPINNTPARVLAAVVARPASLPVTGASNTFLLMVIAGLLIIAGGCFVTAAKLED